MKKLIIGDLHFGEKGNSKKFNQQIIDFLSWSVGIAKQHGVDGIIQAGDYFHTRHEINTETLTYGIKGAEILKDSGIPSYVILGNHDLHYLERLDVSSLNSLRRIVNIVDTPTTLDDGNIVLTPWVANDDIWNTCVDNETNADFIIGHFEFNGFKVNDGYTMEHGLSANALSHYKRVISGHYHSTQTKGNVTYLGTPFPITMNEANEAHGVFILDTETSDLTFIEYETIKVVSIPYEKIDSVMGYDKKNTSIRLEFPDDLEDENLVGVFVQQLIDAGFEEVKSKFKSKKLATILESGDVEVKDVENIDGVVMECIKNSANVDGIDKDLLSDLYSKTIEIGEQ